MRIYGSTAGSGTHPHRSPAARSQRPGREVVQNRVEIGPEAPPIRHRHPGEEIIYVLEGSLEYHVDGESPVNVGAGEVFFVPAEAIHAVRNVGTGNAVELATYVVEKGKPLVELVE